MAGNKAGLGDKGQNHRVGVFYVRELIFNIDNKQPLNCPLKMTQTTNMASNEIK